RFYRRMDGTILTKNCPVGLQAIRDRFSRIRTGIIAATLSFLGHLGLIGAFRTVDRQLGSVTTGVLTYEMGDLGHWVSPDDANPNVPTMGKLVCPSRLSSPGLPIRSESFVRARAIFKVVPIYHSAGSSRPNGDFVVRIIIDEDGSVEAAECVRGNPLIRPLAEEAALRWKFQPIFVNGQPARVQSLLTFRFGK